MKLLGLLLSILTGRAYRRNLRLMALLLAIFVGLVTVFSALFHVLMAAEGQQHSWPTAFYWTLVTMTTLGFGDITFVSDAGRIFSIFVLLAGTLFLLILLPFTFIQLVWVPWMARQEEKRAPRSLPPDTTGHLVLTSMDAMEDALLVRATRAGIPAVVLVAELEEALRLHDRGYPVMVGALDDPETYRAARVGAAALVVATRSDTANSNIVFTVREISEHTPLVATASSSAAVDVLQLAGADDVLQLGKLLGQALFQRILDTGAGCRVLGEIAGLRIAEVTVPTQSRQLSAAMVAQRTGVTVVGAWCRGEFRPVAEAEPLVPGAVLVLAGSAPQLEAFDADLAREHGPRQPVVVIGGGRVGRQVGVSLAAARVPFKIVEKLATRVHDPDRYVVGDAAELGVLKAAGLPAASAVVITTHEDDMNVYLTIYCRRLRPEIQVIARANLDRNVSTLYRAGADAVLSYASTGAAAVWQRLRPGDALLLAEGLEVFRAPAPEGLVGQPLACPEIPAKTGCAVVAVIAGSQTTGCSRGRDRPIPAGAELLLVGDAKDQARFRAAYPRHGQRR